MIGGGREAISGLSICGLYSLSLVNLLRAGWVSCESIVGPEP